MQLKLFVMTSLLLSTAVQAQNNSLASPTPPPHASTVEASSSSSSPSESETEAASTEPASTDPSNPAVTQLPGVEVKQKRDAFSKSDARLKALIDNLPCNGCEVKKIEEKKSIVEKSLTFVAKECCIPTAPRPVDSATDEAGSLDHELSHDSRRPTNLNP